jgi:hypothetical protein
MAHHVDQLTPELSSPRYCLSWAFLFVQVTLEAFAELVLAFSSSKRLFTQIEPDDVDYRFKVDRFLGYQIVGLTGDQVGA